MRKFNPIPLFKDRSTSLFLRLLSGFLCIILLMSSLVLYFYSESKENVREQIVKYNTLMLQHTTESYEKHLDMVKRQMLVFLLSEKAQNLRAAPNYREIPLLQQEINGWTSDLQMYMNNIVFFTRSKDLIVEKGTSAPANSMFNVFYESEAYDAAFWEKQFDEDYSARVLPADVFRNHMFRSATTIVGELVPIVFKTKGSHDFLMIVFLDARKMFESFHQAAGDDFMVMDDTGRAIFRSAGQTPEIDPAGLRQASGGEYVSDGKYYFQSKGTLTGFTYVQRVPVERIASQTRMNITLIVATGFSIAAGIVISWLFATGINNPLQKVIGAIRGEAGSASFRSSIREFNIIRGQLQDKEKMHKQLAFLQQLKAIPSHGAPPPAAFKDEPFVIVLFHAMSRREEDDEQAYFRTWLSYMKVHMEDRLGRAFPESMTFHIEAYQILSLVYTSQREEIIIRLKQMEPLFEQDRAFGTVTVAVSSVYGNAGRIGAAYREAQDLVLERKLADRMQIVTARTAGAETIGFAPDQWKEFQSNLREGNEAQLTSLIKRVFAKWQGKEVPASAWLAFGEGLIGKIKSEASPLVIAPDRLQEIFTDVDRQLQRCITVSELEALLTRKTALAAQAFREKKQLRDPITTFVVEYVNQHLSEEIYLDTLAERLNLSGGYLSSYFKEKTGMNIVDFINETRIMKSASLLVDSKYKVQDVAEAVGYRNITSFNRMFKKYMGLTPSEFRRKPGAER
ncbi:AraC family transcriptional regulator [Cohnella hashimotonis]|uniref:AraC family transcriptional regulator n=1 Tax=Cohnella hashimotonis TaxID=2826895 RepID=A0ABT6TEK4_9BACL|nr:AraC family transcriptional regulator [Cohnella hashimotonis]MDI4644755.1 AraC family transcriptional regulator [Cohnella hashimotonis]